MWRQRQSEGLEVQKMKLLPFAPQTHDILTSAYSNFRRWKEAEEAPAILTAETLA